MPRLELRRAEVPQRRVDPDPVAESLDVLEDLERCPLARLEGPRVHALGLDGAHVSISGREHRWIRGFRTGAHAVSVSPLSCRPYQPAPRAS